MAKLTNNLWNIATEEGYSTTMPKLNRALWNTALILTAVNIVLFFVYLISPYSSQSYYFTTPLAFSVSSKTLKALQSKRWRKRRFLLYPQKNRLKIA